MRKVNKWKIMRHIQEKRKTRSRNYFFKCLGSGCRTQKLQRNLNTYMQKKMKLKYLQVIKSRYEDIL